PATMAAFTADARVVLAPGTGTIPAQGGRPEQLAPGLPMGQGAERYTGLLLPERPSQGWAALLDPTAPRWLRSFGAGEWHYYTAAIALSPDGRTLYLSYDTPGIVAFEGATGKVRCMLNGHAG